MGFDRILRSRYNDIRENLLRVTTDPKRCDEFYRQAFHDADDEKVEAAIRFHIEYHRRAIEAESENNKEVQDFDSD